MNMTPEVCTPYGTTHVRLIRRRDTAVRLRTEHPLAIHSPHLLVRRVIGEDPQAEQLWNGVLLPILKDAITLKLSGHLLRVGGIAGEFDRYLGSSPKDADLTSFAGLFHDAGKMHKIIIDSREVFTFWKILLKPGKLTPQERQLMDTHPELGAQMLHGLPEGIIHTIRHHHDDTDKDRRKKIIAITDVYDSILGHCFRPYLKSEELYKRGARFDEEGKRRFGDDPLYYQFRHWQALNFPA